MTVSPSDIVYERNPMSTVPPTDNIVISQNNIGEKKISKQAISQSKLHNS